MTNEIDKFLRTATVRKVRDDLLGGVYLIEIPSQPSGFAYRLEALDEQIDHLRKKGYKIHDQTGRYPERDNL